MGIWTEVGVLDKDAGEIGGDMQVGPACSRRFKRRLGDGTWHVITLYAYLVQRDDEEDDGGEPWVQTMLEDIRCADPDELQDGDANYEYDDTDYVSPEAWLQQINPNRDLSTSL